MYIEEILYRVREYLISRQTQGLAYVSGLYSGRMCISSLLGQAGTRSLQFVSYTPGLISSCAVILLVGRCAIITYPIAQLRPGTCGSLAWLDS